MKRTDAIVNDVDLAFDRDDVLAPLLLIRSTKADMSVRLPLDRGPATSTRPSASIASAWISRGKPSCSAEMPRGPHQAEHAARAA